MQINSFCKPGRESDREKTKGTPFQSHLVPLCSSLVCLEQVGFVLGRAATPKTRQEMGRTRVVSQQMWILEVFSGTHPERLGLCVPRFCFSFFSPENFLVPEATSCLVPALPPHPLLPLPRHSCQRCRVCTISPSLLVLGFISSSSPTNEHGVCSPA